MGVADAVATVAGHILARLRDDLTPAQETVLRRALHTEAERIHPARTNGAPGWTPGTPPNTAAPLGGETAMAIMHHEDASVYGKGVVHHPLSGRPEFKGLLDGADGPMARIQDGDLVLTIDDMATLLRWRDVFETAAVQLQMGLDRAAANARKNQQPSVYEDMGVRDAIRAEIARQRGEGAS